MHLCSYASSAIDPLENELRRARNRFNNDRQASRTPAPLQAFTPICIDFTNVVTAAIGQDALWIFKIVWQAKRRSPKRKRRSCFRPL